jgi:hypothetical protein
MARPSIVSSALLSRQATQQGEIHENSVSEKMDESTHCHVIVMSLSCHCHVDIPIVKWRMCNLKSDAMLLNHASHASHAPTHPKAKEQWGNDCQTGRFQQAWTFYEDMLNCNISARFLCVALGGTIKSFSAANLLLTFF